MWQQFWFQNIHYTLEVFVAFLMVTASLIYLDAWLTGRDSKTFLRTIGFFILGIWSFIGAAPEGIIGIERLGGAERLSDITGLVGFGLVLLSLLIDPVPVKPGEKPIRFFSKIWSKLSRPLAVVPPTAGSLWQRFSEFFQGALPIFIAVVSEPKMWMFLMSAFITVLLWLHYSKGIQSEWKFFYLGFLAFTISLLLSTSYLWQESPNVLLSNVLAPFQIVWILEHAVKFIGGLCLGLWAWGFVRFLIFPQIFSGFIALSFVIFVSTTILYTGFLLNRTQETIIAGLETNVKTMEFALDKIQKSAILAARITSTNPQVREAAKRDDKDALFKNLNSLMFENGTDFMLVVNRGAEVLMRAEDKERFGDSLAEDPIVWRALEGKAVVTTDSKSSVTMPQVSIRASSPIIDTAETGQLEIIGAVVTGFILDTAFVDGIKKVTGLDITVFAEDTSVATTFTVPETQQRLIGAREVNQQVTDTVLKKAETFTGSAMILSQPFLAVYVPIEDIEETVTGMVFTGRSQKSILDLVSETMRLTFSISIILMIAFIGPIAWLARFITRHQQI